MINVSKYEKKGEHQMPPTTVNPKDKGYDYNLKVVKAVFNLYASNQCSVPFASDQNRTFETLRAYARAKQPTKKYKDTLYPKGSLQKKIGRTFSNISYDNARIMPKFIRSAVGILMQRQYDISIQHIDPTSQKERQELANYLKWKTSPQFRSFSEMVGRKPTGENTAKYPDFQTPKHVDLFVRSGGLLLDREIELWKLMQHTYQESGMEGIRLKHAYDLLEIGCIASNDYVDPRTHKVLAEYRNPERCIVQHSIHEDHHDIDFGGFHEEVSIGYLRNYTPVGDCRKLSDKELFEIAKGYKDQFSNPNARVFKNGAFNFNTVSAQDYFTRNQAHAIDDFKTTIATIYFTDQDVVKYTEAVHSRGNLMVNTVDPDYELSPKDQKKGKRVVTTKPTYTRFVKWVVGTDYLLDYGKVDYAPRENSDKNFKSKLPFHFYRMADPSMVESCIGFIDDLQLSLLKLRNTKAKMPPAPRMVIRKRYLENVTLGGVKMKPLELLDIFGESGTLLINDSDDFGNPNVRGQAADFLPTGIAEDLKLLRDDILFNIEQIRLNTGINELVDATTPSPEQGLGVANLTVDATNNALKTTTLALEKHNEQLLYSAASRWQSVLLNNEIDVSYLPNGEQTYEVFRVSKRQSLQDLGIIIEVRSNVAERNQMIMELVNLKNKRTQTGNGGITEADFLYIRRIIMSGNLNLAQQVLAQLTEERMLEDMEVAAISMENTIKEQQTSAEYTHKMKLEQLNVEYDRKIELAIKLEEEKRKTIAMQKGIDVMAQQDLAPTPAVPAPMPVPNQPAPQNSMPV